ncbi:Serine/threonine exchanger SteT [Methylococcales bacterium]|nr:Serine/threonine exchanger SteT [Methylococcales bacterium]
MQHKFGFTTSTSIVISNMIGTGIFTSLGFQVFDIQTGFSIVVLWLLGGIISLFGAFAYSELGTIYPESGGEYNYLSRIYHPAIGFLSGWVSFLIGFAAPVAAASIAFSKYFDATFGISTLMGEGFPINVSMLLAVFLVLVLSFVHSTDRKTGSILQISFTALKILAIIALIAAGLLFGNASGVSFIPSDQSFAEMITPAFAVSMFFVTYSYSGWNASAYMAGEIANPKRNIPLSLITGTFIVTLLYVLINMVFMMAVPVEQLQGKVEIGYIFADTVFGLETGKFMGGIISLLLISTISSMILAGPRVNEVLGKNVKTLRFLAKHNSKGIPQLAIYTQAILSLLYIITATFDRVIVFIGFSLNLFTFLTVVGVLILRIKKPGLPRTYKMFGYPVTWAFFLLVNLWILVYGLVYKPEESLVGLGICLIGAVVYFVEARISGRDSNTFTA